MLTYSVTAALESGLFDKVYVSTEDREIASIAEQAGAAVHARPPELAGDLVSATEVCLEAEKALSVTGEHCDAIVCLQPSSPFRSAEDIRFSWKRFISDNAHYLVSVTAIDPHYFHWAVHETKEGWQMYFGDEFLKERSLLPPIYRPNGAIKIGRVEALRATRHFFGSPLSVYMMPEERSIHVAEHFDFQLAEYLMQNQNVSGKGQR